MYLLETNVISELRKPRPHRAVVAWLESIDDSQLFLSAVTLGEIQAGIERPENRMLARQAKSKPGLNGWPAASMCWLWMQPRSAVAMIGATARVHGLTVVTRNVADFDTFGVEVFNPFTAAMG